MPIKRNAWNEDKEIALRDMEKKYKQQLEKAVNFLGGEFDSPDAMLSDKNNKTFSDFGFSDHVLYYRKPEKYWNEVGLLVPDDLKLDRNAPVHVFFQGGGFWTGDWKFCPWYLQASLRQAKEQGAIILAVNYPRFPLADIRDITRAVDDFWDYYHSSDLINDYKACVPGLKIDRKKLLVSGESAGGFLAAYSVARPHPEQEVNALFLRYPMLRHYERVDRDKTQLVYMGKPIQKKDVEKAATDLWELTKAIRGEMKELGLLGLSDEGIFADILDRRSPPYGMCGAFISSWCGTWSNYFGQTAEGDRLPDILTQLEMVNNKNQTIGLSKAPALFIYHGADDTNVSPEVSDTLVRLWRQVFKRASGIEPKIGYTKVGVAAHGFDYVLDDEFMSRLIKDISKSWISG